MVVDDQKDDLTPVEIRAVRKLLGLSQAEAGRLLGGGPKAFSKFETGVVKPSAAFNNLLRLLRDEKSAAVTLLGPKYTDAKMFVASPFDVTGQDIGKLSPDLLHDLLRRLLGAEAMYWGIPLDGIHVASKVNSPDGGEDGHIKWCGDPKRTPFLPSSYCQFQLKAGDLSPKKFGEEILTKGGAVKELVKMALDSGASYIMLSGQQYTQKQLNDRTASLFESLCNAGTMLENGRVEIRDADQMAAWANCHPAVSAWVRENTNLPSLGPFRSWSHWARRAEHARSKFINDDRLADLTDQILERVQIPRSAVRIVGLSGVGKSRLTLEAFRATDGEEPSAGMLSDYVIYASLNESRSESISMAIHDLVSSGGRAIVIVDRCDSKFRRDLTSLVLHENSQLSLVILEDELPDETPDRNSIQVVEAPDSVIEGILNEVVPELAPIDRFRLARLAKGFPEMAFLISEAFRQGKPISKFTDAEFVAAYIRKDTLRDPVQVLNSAKLLATFGLIEVGVKDDRALHEVASFMSNPDLDSLHADFDDLLRRGKATKRGNFIVLKPRPMALLLAEMQWREWRPRNWDKVFSRDLSPRLQVVASYQLALLNTTFIAKKVVDHVCREGGPLEGIPDEGLFWQGEVLTYLAEVSPQSVAELIERYINAFEDPSNPTVYVCPHIVNSLRKIAFRKETFEHGALQLLRCAMVASNSLRGGTDRIFKELFLIPLGGTEADGETRLRFLKQHSKSDNQVKGTLVIEALCSGLERHEVRWLSRAEAQGSSPALKSWRPATGEEEIRYIQGCTSCLLEIAIRGDKLGETARHQLGALLEVLVRQNCMDLVEKIVHEVQRVESGWLYGLRRLYAVLWMDGEILDSDLTQRVQTLIDQLQPKEIEDRLKLLVKEPPMLSSGNKNIDTAERVRIQEASVKDLATEVLDKPALLVSVLPKLVQGQQSMAYVFGMSLAEHVEQPLELFEEIIQATLEVPKQSRNFDLLAGFFRSLHKNWPDSAKSFKGQMAESPDLAPELPRFCLLSDLGEPELALVVSALKAGMLPPLQLEKWAMRGVLGSIPVFQMAVLVDSILDVSSEAYLVVIHLVSVFASDRPSELHKLQPQICRLAENVACWGKFTSQKRQGDMTQYYFGHIMNKMLSGGRQDPDACATALALSKAVSQISCFNDGCLFEEILPVILSGFPEIAWPLIGHAIVSDRKRAKLFELVLGDSYPLGIEPKPHILNLPEETIFAWCHAHPEAAPSFTASVLPVLAATWKDEKAEILHPLTQRLLDEFGYRDDVRDTIELKMHTSGWVNLEVNKYKPFMEPLNRLHEHPNPDVQEWAKNLSRRLVTEEEKAQTRDEERKAFQEF